MQPAPAPLFSRTPAGRPAAPPLVGADTDAVLTDWGFSGEELIGLRAADVIRG